MLKEWSKFYLINTGAIEEHIVAWSYKHGEDRFYMFLPHGKIHNIGEAQAYATKEEAEKEFVKRLKESAQANIDAADKIEKDGMVCTIIEQDMKAPEPLKENWLNKEKK